jgi:Dihydroprymidine dehydrogenase domain II, 4Fe-4S cluster/NAD(P)-binding Rossmann-like domain
MSQSAFQANSDPGIEEAIGQNKWDQTRVRAAQKSPVPRIFPRAVCAEQRASHGTQYQSILESRHHSCDLTRDRRTLRRYGFNDHKSLQADPCSTGDEMAVRVTLPQLAHWKAQVKCQAGCPVATDAGRYVQLLAEGRLEEAYLVARAPNPFASVCGRVCAAPCEDVCRRGAIDAPIAIRALKRHLTEQYGVESIRPDTQNRLRTDDINEGNRYASHFPLPLHRTQPSAREAAPRRVAVIGAGPAGLAAAHDLAILGHGVTIFEAGDE